MLGSFDPRKHVEECRIESCGPDGFNPEDDSFKKRPIRSGAVPLFSKTRFRECGVFVDRAFVLLCFCAAINSSSHVSRNSSPLGGGGFLRMPRNSAIALR